MTCVFFCTCRQKCNQGTYQQIVNTRPSRANRPVLSLQHSRLPQYFSPIAWFGAADMVEFARHCSKEMRCFFLAMMLVKGCRETTDHMLMELKNWKTELFWETGGPRSLLRILFFCFSVPGPRFLLRIHFFSFSVPGHKSLLRIQFVSFFSPSMLYMFYIFSWGRRRGLVHGMVYWCIGNYCNYWSMCVYICIYVYTYVYICLYIWDPLRCSKITPLKLHLKRVSKPCKYQRKMTQHRFGRDSYIYIYIYIHHMFLISSTSSGSALQRGRPQRPRPRWGSEWEGWGFEYPHQQNRGDKFD